MKKLTQRALKKLAEDNSRLRKENNKLRERLEMTHVWQLIDGKMIRRRVARGHFLTGPAIYDGIDCRNETIRQQDRYIAELELRIAAHEHNPNAKTRAALREAKRYDESGFDPRDGGKVYVDGIHNSPKPNTRLVRKPAPDRKVLSARIRSKKPSSWPPSARPPKRSP
jgi:cell division septum initiation protein DivIVA